MKKLDIIHTIATLLLCVLVAYLSHNSYVNHRLLDALAENVFLQNRLEIRRQLMMPPCRQHERSDEMNAAPGSRIRGRWLLKQLKMF